jgi:hypothetical protein
MSKPAAGNQSNSLLLRRQLVELTKHPVEGFSAGGCLFANDLPDPNPLNVQGLVDDDNLYEWEILIIGYVEHIPVATRHLRLWLVLLTPCSTLCPQLAEWRVMIFM